MMHGGNFFIAEGSDDLVLYRSKNLGPFGVVRDDL